MKPFRAFVVGTDTGVGKTQVASALLSILADERLNPAPFKPYETGVVRKNAPEDACTLREAAQSDDPIELVCPHQFRVPLAPGIAARRLGVEPDFAKTIAAFRSFSGRSLITEAAGGLRVPIDSKREVLDLVKELKLPAVLVGRAALGTLNHAALSLDALRSKKIPVLAVVLSRSRKERDPSERDNAQFIAERHGVTVLGPVPYEEDARRRRAAFKRALRPFVLEHLR